MVFVGVGLICFASVLLSMGLLKKRNSFLNLNDVLKKHLSLFKECKSQYLTFYIYPLILSVGIALISQLDANTYQNLIVVVSIFMSMLFAMMSILTTKEWKTDSKDKNERIKNVVDETVNAIIFDTILFILEILICLILIAIDTIMNELATQIMSGVVVYIFSVCILTMLLIVKRVSKLLKINTSED